MVQVMDKGAAGKSRSNVANRTNDGSPKLTASQAWTAGGGVIEGGTHAARIRENLADGDEGGKGSCESEADNAVQPSSDSEASAGGKDAFPSQPVITQSARP